MPPLRYLPYHLQCHPNLGPNQTPQTLGYLCLARKSAPGPDSPMSESCRIFGRKVSGKDIRRRFSEWFACHDLNRLWSRISHLTNQKAEKRRQVENGRAAQGNQKVFGKVRIWEAEYHTVLYFCYFLLQFLEVFVTQHFFTFFSATKFWMKTVFQRLKLPVQKLNFRPFKNFLLRVF